MNSLNRWKFITVILFLICLGLVYRVFDMGITNTYVRASEETSNAHIKLLADLIQHQWLGSSEEQVLSRLNMYVSTKPAGTIVLKSGPEKNVTYLEGIRFEFKNGKLISIT